MRAIVIHEEEGGQQVEVTDVNEDDLPEGDVTHSTTRTASLLRGRPLLCARFR